MSSSLPNALLIDTWQAELPALLAAYLFGSYVRQREGPASDIDIAVLEAGKVDPVGLWEIAEAIAARIDTDIDPLDRRAAFTVIQYQIIMKKHLDDFLKRWRS